MPGVEFDVITIVLFVGSGVELSSCDLLREGAPIEPVPPVSHWKPDAVVRETSAVHVVQVTVRRSCPGVDIRVHVEACGCYNEPMHRCAATGVTRRKRFQNDVPQSQTHFGMKLLPHSRHRLRIGLITQSGRISTSVPYSSSITKTGLASRLPSATTSTAPTPSRRRTATRSSCVMPMSSAILSAGLCCRWAPVHGFSLRSPRCDSRFRVSFGTQQNPFENALSSPGRALQFPPEGWLRMGLNNGSITWLTIRPSGRVALRALGDAGFMPPEKLTRT